MIVGPLLVLGVAYYARGALAARSNAPVLNVSDADTLKSVFFSGEPWLVECTSAKRPSPAVFAVEKLMAAQPVASEVKLGLLDCGATLPSGKSTLERFKLQAPSDGGPLVLLFANQEARPAMAISPSPPLPLTLTLTLTLTLPLPLPLPLTPTPPLPLAPTPTPPLPLAPTPSRRARRWPPERSPSRGPRCFAGPRRRASPR